MLHFRVWHKFITESGKVILIDGDYTLRTAEEKAKFEDKTAKYAGIEFTC